LCDYFAVPGSRVGSIATGAGSHERGNSRLLLRRNNWPATDSGFRSVEAYAADYLKNCEEFQGRPLYQHKLVTIFRYTPPILSLKFEADEDGGGVHPFGTTWFINVDMSTGRTLGLADIFQPDALP
jgi:hypothetical protein